MKVDVKTLNGETMAAQHATQSVGTALRIAPHFVVTASDDRSQVETTLEAHYRASPGRYVITRVVNRAMTDEFNEYRLKHTASQAILRAAVPRCVALRLDDSPDAEWTAVADLAAGDGQIIPPWLAEAVVKRGVKDERWEVIEILYGIAMLAELPAVKLIAQELDVPERTAQYWIRSARDAGWLVGMATNVGRPIDG